MTPQEFEAAFDTFSESAFRMETLPEYLVGGAEAVRIEAWRTGRPRPERSVRTDPWLRRIAVTTAAGRLWQRLRVVDDPISDYQRYQLVGYGESAAVGEEIRLVDRQAYDRLAPRPGDFWLFDGHLGEAAYAVVTHYDSAGQPVDDELVRGTRLDAYRRARSALWTAATPLSNFLAATGTQTSMRVA